MSIYIQSFENNPESPLELSNWRTLGAIRPIEGIETVEELVSYCRDANPLTLELEKNGFVNLSILKAYRFYQ